VQDKFFNKFNENFSENELYISLIDEMSKYKTLTHDTIKWDFVFSSSLKALSEFSLDVKLLNFLIISIDALAYCLKFDFYNANFQALC